MAVVADSFHIKPLLRILQSADRYQVLSVNRREIKFFEGNRDNLHEIELESGIPRTITEALGEERTEPHHSVGSFGMRHGHGSRADEIDVDEQRFFRVVDRAILEYDSRPSGMPLILAALRHAHTIPPGFPQPVSHAQRNEVTPPRLPSTIAPKSMGDRRPEFDHAWRSYRRIEEAKAKGLRQTIYGSRPAAGVTRVGSLLVEANGGFPDTWCTDWANHVRQSGRYGSMTS